MQAVPLDFQLTRGISAVLWMPTCRDRFRPNDYLCRAGEASSRLQRSSSRLNSNRCYCTRWFRMVISGGSNPWTGSNRPNATTAVAEAIATCCLPSTS